MTSLGASLPPPGSSVWRSDRAAPGEDDQVVSESRVRHVVIREATIRPTPTKHVIYQIEVNTQSDRWQVERRYSEFVALQAAVQQLHSGKKGNMLPAKRLIGNLTAAVIEERRQGLERYLQRLVNGEKEVVFSPALLKFLEVNEHNVIWVAQHLARHLQLYGERILSAEVSFHITATQANCIARRMKLPMDSKTVHQTLEPCGEHAEPVIDLSNLYDFVFQQGHLCVHPRRSVHIKEEHAPVLAVTADLSPWRSLTKLDIDHFAIGYFDGLSVIQENLTELRVAHGDVKDMRQVVLDSVARKRAIPQARAKVEGWRQAALKNFAENRTYQKPWIRLTMLDLSSNSIAEFDSACLDQLPALERLVLRWNEIVNLNSWFKHGPIMPRLHEINLSCNKITTLETIYTEADRSNVRAPSISLRAAPVAVASPKKLEVNINAQWVDSSALSKSVPFGQIIKATPENTLPPSYKAHHLISTDAPKASLDELQRRRSQRLATSPEEDVVGSLPVGSSDSVVAGRKASLVPAGTLERIKAVASDQAIGGELDVRKRMESPGARTDRMTIPNGIPQNTLRCFYRLAPALGTLILSNNRLTSLRGLEHLNALEYLDVSFNAIATTKGLSALVHMTKLRLLLLEGNPLATARGYRADTASRFLGPRETTIDGKAVSAKS